MQSPNRLLLMPLSTESKGILCTYGERIKIWINYVWTKKMKNKINQTSLVVEIKQWIDLNGDELHKTWDHGHLKNFKPMVTVSIQITKNIKQLISLQLCWEVVEGQRIIIIVTVLYCTNLLLQGNKPVRNIYA